MGAISYNSWSHLAFLQGKVNSARCIAQVVNPVLLPFPQEGDVLFRRPMLIQVMDVMFCQSVILFYDRIVVYAQIVGFYSNDERLLHIGERICIHSLL